MSDLKAAADKAPRISRLPFEIHKQQDIEISVEQELRFREAERSLSRTTTASSQAATLSDSMAWNSARTPTTSPPNNASRSPAVTISPPESQLTPRTRHAPEPLQRRKPFPLAEAIKAEGVVQSKRSSPAFYNEIRGYDPETGRAILVKKKSTYPRLEGGNETAQKEKEASRAAGLGISIKQPGSARENAQSVIQPTPEMTAFLNPNRNANGPPSPTASETASDDSASHYSGDTIIATASERSTAVNLTRRETPSKAALERIKQNAQARRTRNGQHVPGQDQVVPRPSPATRPKFHLPSTSYTDRWDSAVDVGSSASTPTAASSSPHSDIERTPPAAVHPAFRKLGNSSPSIASPTTPHSLDRSPRQQQAAFVGRSNFTPPIKSSPLAKDFATPDSARLPYKQRAAQSVSPTPEHFDSIIQDWQKAGDGSSPSSANITDSPSAVLSKSRSIGDECSPLVIRKASKSAAVFETPTAKSAAFNKQAPAPASGPASTKRVLFPSSMAERQEHPAEAVPEVATDVQAEGSTPATPRTSGLDNFKIALHAEVDTDTHETAVSPLSVALEETVTPATIHECYQHFREELGQSEVRPRSDTDPKHPNHPHAWTTNTLMCKDKHTQPVAASIASNSRGPVDIKVTRCHKCGEYCCYYTELLTYYNQVSRNASMAAHFKEARVHLGKLVENYPHGIEEYSPLITCRNRTCRKIVCPEHAQLCGFVNGGGKKCVRAICKDCSKGGNAHQHTHRF